MCGCGESQLFGGSTELAFPTPLPQYRPTKELCAKTIPYGRGANCGSHWLGFAERKCNFPPRKVHLRFGTREDLQSLPQHSVGMKGGKRDNSRVSTTLVGVFLVTPSQVWQGLPGRLLAWPQHHRCFRKPYKHPRSSAEEACGISRVRPPGLVICFQMSSQFQWPPSIWVELEQMKCQIHQFCLAVILSQRFVDRQDDGFASEFSRRNKQFSCLSSPPAQTPRLTPQTE